MHSRNAQFETLPSTLQHASGLYFFKITSISPDKKIRYYEDAKGNSTAMVYRRCMHQNAEGAGQPIYRGTV
jgi:hypothetical protein